MDKGFSDNKIEKSEKNWETLATAWRHSSEWKKSRAPLLEAAKLSKEGKHYLKLGESYIHNEDWANAEKYLALSLEKGKLGDKEEDVWFLLGIAQAKQEQYQKAIKTFRKAGEFDDVGKRFIYSGCII